LTCKLHAKRFGDFCLRRRRPNRAIDAKPSFATLDNPRRPAASRMATAAERALSLDGKHLWGNRASD